MDTFILQVKIRYNEDWNTVNKNFIMNTSEMDAMSLTRKNFFMSYKEASKLKLYLIMDRGYMYTCMRIVDCSHYPPYPDHAVVDYQEFKCL